MQDVIQERMQSMQMHIGFNNAGTYKELGGKAEVASRNAAWTNAVGSIIGTQVTRKTYHGHMVKKFDKLEQHQQNALKKAKNLVTKSGKIIK